MALGTSSGAVTQASGWAPTGRTLYLEPLPVGVYGSGQVQPVTIFSGSDGNTSLNVNISGGVVSASFTPPSPQSGQYVMLSGGFAGISGLPVTASVSVSPPAYQSGTLVALSGGFAGISGLPVTTTVNPFGLQSGTMVILSGGFAGISGLPVSVSGNLVLVASGGTLLVSGNVIVTTSGVADVIVSTLSGQPLPVSGIVAVISGGTLPITGGVTVSGGVQVSGTVAISNTLFALSGGGITISGGVTVSGLVGISGGGLTISGGVTVSGTVSITSGNVYVTSGAVNDLSGLVTPREWPSYTMTVFWSGPAGVGLFGLSNYGSGVAAGQSGMVLEITRIEVGIYASGNINRLDLYRTDNSVVQMSGPKGTIVPYYSGNAVSIASGFVISSSGMVSGAWSGVTPIESLYLEANSSGYMHNYAFDFNSWRMQNPQVTSGQDFLAIMTSGIGVGMASVDWIERYLS